LDLSLYSALATYVASYQATSSRWPTGRIAGH